MSKPTESAEQIAHREYRIRTKDMSADRLVPYEIYRLRLAIESASENSGKWLGTLDATLENGLTAIALAASTPEDNSAQILELATKVKTVREKLKTSVDSQNKGD